MLNRIGAGANPEHDSGVLEPGWRSLGAGHEVMKQVTSSDDTGGGLVDSPQPDVGLKVTCTTMYT